MTSGLTPPAIAISGRVSIALISGMAMPVGDDRRMWGYFFRNAWMTARSLLAQMPVSSGRGRLHTVRWTVFAAPLASAVSAEATSSRAAMT